MLNVGYMKAAVHKLFLGKLGKNWQNSDLYNKISDKQNVKKSKQLTQTQTFNTSFWSLTVSGTLCYRDIYFGTKNVFSWIPNPITHC